MSSHEVLKTPDPRSNTAGDSCSKPSMGPTSVDTMLTATGPADLRLIHTGGWAFERAGTKSFWLSLSLCDSREDVQSFYVELMFKRVGGGGRKRENTFWDRCLHWKETGNFRKITINLCKAFSQSSSGSVWITEPEQQHWVQTVHQHLSEFHTLCAL